jgi:hypothetical protein
MNEPEALLNATNAAGKLGVATRVLQRVKSAEATRLAIDQVRAWFDPADAARYAGWGYRTFWRKVKAGLPVYYATDRTSTVYRYDIDAFQQGATSTEMPSRQLRLKLHRRAA